MVRGFLLCLVAAVGACIGTGAWKYISGAVRIIPSPQAASVVDCIRPGETPQERYQAMLAWNQRTLKEAYDKVGMTDRRWDAQAQDTLDAMARFLTDSQDQPVTQAELHSMAKKLVATGCQDPLILYVFARSQPKAGTKWSTAEIDHFRWAAMAMQRSAYPPLRRIAAMKHLANALLEARTTSVVEFSEARAWLTAALEILPQSVAEDERIRDVDHQQLDLTLDVLDAFKRIDRTDLATSYQRVDDLLVKHPSLEIIRLKLRGAFFITHAWEARGTEFASKVTEDGWRKMRSRLSKARLALEKAWELHPRDCLVPELMISVCLGEGTGREEMEAWYRRGVETCVLDYGLCQAKLRWLSTRWYGKPGERIEFAKSLRDPKLWRGDPPFYVSEAHLDTADLEFFGKHLGPYFRRPEVMRDIREEFDAYLTRRPQDDAIRSTYAYFCYLGDDYATSHMQFQKVGDRLVPTVRWTEAMMKKARSTVAKQVQQSAQGAHP